MSATHECSVCWYGYDPDRGDEIWPVAPGTPFEALPGDWCCPRCEGARATFVRTVEPPATEGASAELEERVAGLEAAYRRIGAERMADLPIYNRALEVEAVCFAPSPDDPQIWLGLVVTPWFMNVVRLPREPSLWADRRDGEVASRALPSGAYEFTLTRVEGVGPLESCSLFSPMGGFDDQPLARQVAEEAFAELLRPAPGEDDEDDVGHEGDDASDGVVDSEPGDEGARRDAPSRASAAPVSRRGLLRGRLVGGR